MQKTYSSFAEFYPFYLSQHSDPKTRKMHYIGSSIVILLFMTLLATGNFFYLLLMPIAGYGFAWFGHYRIEKNRPATFTYPVYSLVGDFVMLMEAATGRLNHSHFLSIEERQEVSRRDGFTT